MDSTANVSTAGVRAIQRLADFATLERIRNYTLLMAVLALGGGVVQLALGHGLIDSFGNVVGADFLAFYTGAQFFLQDRLADIYDLAAQLEFQQQLVEPGRMKGVHPFISPPNALLLYVGFGVWSYPVGLALWWLTGIASLLLSVSILRVELPRLRGHSIPILFAASFLYFPTSAWFLYGQATPLILLIYTGTFVLLRREKDFAAGACLGCLAFKPQLAVAVALMLAVKWRWRALLGGLTALGGWLGAGFLIAPDAMLHYLDVAPNLPDLLRSPDYPGWGVHSLFGFSFLLLDGLSARAADLLAWALSALLLLLLGRRFVAAPWRAGSARWDFDMAAVLALGIVLSPHLFVYDLMLLLLPFAIVWNRWPSRDGTALDGGPVLAWTAVLWGVSFVGSYLSLAQLRLCALFGLPRSAVQISTLVIVTWVVAILHASREFCDRPSEE